MTTDQRVLSPVQRAKLLVLADLQDWQLELCELYTRRNVPPDDVETATRLRDDVLKVMQSIRTGLVGLAIDQLDEIPRNCRVLYVGAQNVPRESRRLAQILRDAIGGNS